MTGKIIAQKLHSMENGIMGALNSPQIIERMIPYGYTPERIQSEGRALWDKANELAIYHSKKYGEQFESTAQSQLLLEKAYQNYIVTLKIVRIAFKDNVELLKGLDATGKRSRSYSGWLKNSRVFYTNLLSNPAALDRLIMFNVTADRLTNELDEVNCFEELYTQELAGKADAQQSTVDRDQAFDELCNWYSDFRAIARIALYDKPQLLEAMGIVKR